MRSPEVTCLSSINRARHEQCLVPSLIAAMPQPLRHIMFINRAARILQDPEQHVDKGPCQETCSPMHPTETLLLLFLPSPMHTHLLQPFSGRRKQLFTGERRASHSHGKGWKALLRPGHRSSQQVWQSTSSASVVHRHISSRRFILILLLQCSAIFSGLEKMISAGGTGKVRTKSLTLLCLCKLGS